MSRRTEFPVFCHCGAEIEACDGRFGDWMHTATRRERCADGGVATPQGPTAVQIRLSRRRAS